MVLRNKYRSQLQIISDILSIVKNGSKKTHIMFQANLSYKLLCHYLYTVLEAGLVECASDCYFITEKGELFLEKFIEYTAQKKGLENKIKLLMNKKEMLEDMCPKLVQE